MKPKRYTANAPVHKAKKSLGQNFIRDRALLEAIVESTPVTQEDHVLEIGSGLGDLTAILSERAKHVTSVEIDDTLEGILKERFASAQNVRLIQGDALKIKAQELMQAYSPYHIVANIPYYITTDLLNKFVRPDPALRSVNVMVQKEAAERMFARPGTPEWGLLAIRIALWGFAETALEVPAACFEPAPKCDSAFVRILPHEQPLYSAEECEQILKTATAALMMRRKTLVNNLIAGFHLSREQAARIVQSCGFDENVRGEVLDLKELYQLTKAIQEG